MKSKEMKLEIRENEPEVWTGTQEVSVQQTEKIYTEQEVAQMLNAMSRKGI